jgi:hypothetical protein
MKNGKKTKVSINKERNECRVQSIECILNKNKCREIFQNFQEVMDDLDEDDNMKDKR